MNEPEKPEPPQHQPQPSPEVNPDPKAHPIHPAIPAEVPFEGTDPKQPINPGIR